MTGRPDDHAAGGSLWLTVLGSIALEQDSVPVELGARRQRAVLARLAAAGGRVVSTDRLIDDLWNGEPPPKALGGLQVHVSNLRRILEPDRPPRTPARLLVSEPPGYALRLLRESVDVWLFEDLVTEPGSDPATRYERTGSALTLWRGEPYGPHAGERWAESDVARLRELHLAASEVRADAALQLGRAGEVVAALPALCEEHPTREELFRLLAVAYYRLGRQADALQTLRRLRDHLADELGVDPGPALRETETAILNQDPALSHVADPVVAHPTAAAAPVVPPQVTDAPDRVGDSVVDEPAGREAELEKLSAHAESASSAGLRIVWITAEAGGGKSTLAQSLVQRLQRLGWTAAVGHCPEVDGAPAAWAWREILTALGGTGDVGDPFQVAREVTAECSERSGAGLLLVLDDVHRADSATLQVLRQVVTWLAGRPVLVVATYRPSEAGTELMASGASLVSITADFLALSGLSDEGIRELAASVGLEPLDAPTLDLLRTRTDGNPLFVRELAKLVASRGPRGADTTVPTGIRDVLLRRIDRLPPAVASMLRVLAVVGREADIDTIVALSDGADDESVEDAVLDSVDTAVVAGLLSADVDRVRFNHVLVRDSVYEGIPALRRRRMHWQAVGHLRSRPDTDADELAHHAALGAGAATASEALELVEAAARARFATDFKADSVQLWQFAIDLHRMAGHDQPTADVTDRIALIDALRASVTALAHRGDFEVARRRRNEALMLAEAVGNRAVVRSVLTCWRTPVTWTTRSKGVSDPVMTTAVLRELADAVGPDRIRLLVTATFEFEGNDDPLSRKCAFEAVGLLSTLDTDDIELRCAALNALVYVSLGPDHRSTYAESVAEFSRAVDESGVLAYQAAAHFFQFLVHTADIDLPGAITEVQRSLQCASSGRVGELMVVLSAFGAVLDVLRGNLEAAEFAYAELARQLTAVGAPSGAELGVVGKVVIGWARGSLAHMVDEVAAVYERSPHAIAWVYVVSLLDAGREDEARFVATVDPPDSRDYYWSAMAMFHARAVVRLGLVERAQGLYDELLPWSGRVAGLDSGSLAFSPIDVVLAELADLLGNAGVAERHRASGRAVEERVRVGLAAVDAMAAGG
ncbi:AfsR/SARP family transcriptional regulator [Gordonia soli]|uniref:Putative regulatory protein n=1 Tax=Gordonia soli NBRC 108243 TaxID=1223545 RepID=M0QKT8_9ACTN|nr:AfsR/SARP family transcriptional regulator [Gordonia soli]GAC69178.1 putative regulatory protein [Gordonia soli NBRC 108243]